jgi:hypothetical protein
VEEELGPVSFLHLLVLLLLILISGYNSPGGCGGNFIACNYPNGGSQSTGGQLVYNGNTFLSGSGSFGYGGPAPSTIGVCSSQPK